jgi:uncharacterized hydrophobic protein (TIGR00271 family)
MGLGSLLHGGEVDAAEVARVRDVLVFEGSDVTDRLVKFAALLVLSSAIATFGLIGDSVATVIGAMIVAPLMTPIMGTAFGVSIGDRKVALRSFIAVMVGVAIAIGLGFVLSLPFHSVIDPITNSQIASRTNPRLIDLCAAIATGFAGAFAISRKDVSDTLPGVAIAISLVPPLANVGILLSVGATGMALGSMLLFTTNLMAILLAGSVVLGVMGFSRVALGGHGSQGRRIAIATIVVLTLALAVPLGLTGRQAVITQLVQSEVSQASATWLQGTDYGVTRVSTDGTVTVQVQGSGTLPPMEVLAARLAGRTYGAPVVVGVVGERTYRVTSQ